MTSIATPPHLVPELMSVRLMLQNQGFIIWQDRLRLTLHLSLRHPNWETNQHTEKHPV